ncbi:MAG: bifunctional riboflavin kinase/FAD synthetase [Lachnospiraceae bacterium]|nr:bifunctional riboflavin kinase/FAD synthetase [Lachnospiraceae bacterium]
MQCFKNITKQTVPSCVALGCFDGIHLGHKKIISEMCRYAKEREFESSVFTFAVSPSALLGHTPQRSLISQTDKMAVLNNMGVQKCFTADFMQVMQISPEDFVHNILIDKLNAKAVFCGFNYRFGKAARGDIELLRRLCRQSGAELFVASPVCIGGDVVSSSRIRDLIENGDVHLAATLLGRNFFIEEKIVEGKHIGRTVGKPTVNQMSPNGFVTPKFGVYASFITVDDKRYRAITNVGVRPTVGGGNKNYETHILDNFCGELYGKTVRTELINFVREERKFDSMQDLSEQIERDIKWIEDNKIF